MIPVSTIITRVVDLLMDYDRTEGKSRWSTDELIRWLNEGCVEVLARKPSSCAKVTNHILVEGTHQTIPANGTILFDVICNVVSAVTPTTPNALPKSTSPVRRTDKNKMDAIVPTWHYETPSSVIKHYMFEERTPLDFFVYPPSVAGAMVKISYAAVPAIVTALTDSLDMNYDTVSALTNYVTFRAKSKDGQYASAAEAQAFYALFEASIGSQNNSQSVVSPNQPGNA